MMQTSSQHEELKAMAYTPFEAQLVADTASSLDDIVGSTEKKQPDETGMTFDDMLMQQQQQQQPKKVPPPNGKKTKGRVKIKMEFIDNKLRRYTTFSKRKTGIMKKVRATDLRDIHSSAASLACVRNERLPPDGTICPCVRRIRLFPPP